VVRGRNFAAQDDASHPRVVIINEAFVRTYFPGEDPLGQHLLYAPTTSSPAMEIVGIVADVKENPLDAVTPPTMYTPFAQDASGGFWLFARTSRSEDALLAEVVPALRALDAGLTTSGGTRLTRLVDDSEPAYLRRSGAWLVGAFAMCAWLLGVVGLYGVVAYSVGRRTREIGVRMALGAQRSSVARLILSDASRVITVGVLAGVLGAAGAATLAQSLLFGVTAWDPPTLLGVAALLGASALVASYVPARRASGLNPIDALRAQ
jgi:hypothetical protein